MMETLPLTLPFDNIIQEGACLVDFRSGGSMVQVDEHCSVSPQMERLITASASFNQRLPPLGCTLDQGIGRQAGV